MAYKVVLENKALDDLLKWTKEDIKMLSKIFVLIENVSKTPFAGIGKPEPLKQNMSGFWTRRIT